MRAIRKVGSMRGVWKRSHGRATKAPPDERGGNRHARPNAIPRHTSTLPTPAIRWGGSADRHDKSLTPFRAEWAIRHPIRTVLSGAWASAKPALVPGGNWSAHVTRATQPDEVSP